MTKGNFKFYEFFAGGGMARAGLGEDWQCLFANDFDEKKASSYRANWGTDELFVKDVAQVKMSDLPGVADLVWASFPCQDLSLAGAGAGLAGGRSGTFWPFWKLIERLKKESRAPKLVVLENVYGAITSHDGRDFAAIGKAFAKVGYRFGALVIDAALFVPQSRPRLFIVGVRDELQVPEKLCSETAHDVWHPKSLRTAVAKLEKSAAGNHFWIHLPLPTRRENDLVDIIEREGAPWDSPEKTKKILGMMSVVNKKKVEKAKTFGRMVIGGIYMRTRDGIQRAEVRFDGIAGCLRTPGGGSSRQTIIAVEGDIVRTRLLTTREGARLMGLPDTYELPEKYNDAYHLVGDGVVVPVVKFLADNFLTGVLAYKAKKRALSNRAA